MDNLGCDSYALQFQQRYGRFRSQPFRIRGVPEVKVEIWSDVVCPWCYIGKRRFEKALESFPHRDEVEVVYRSFQLDPGAQQVYPGSNDELLAEKFGGDLERAKAMNAQVSEMAAQEGLDYRLDEARPGNTLDAHRLLHFAAAKGRGNEAKERLLRAYFTDGKSIGDQAELAGIFTEMGFDRDEVERVLAGDDYRQEVDADFELGRSIGVQGVPFFVFGRRYAVSGAQPTELFGEVLEKTWEEAQPAEAEPAVPGHR
mgnify:CR=1 FL=1